jgi:hypothetical protein
MFEINDYNDFCNTQVAKKCEDILVIVDQQKLIKNFGISSAFVGDFTAGFESLRLVSVGDSILTKYGNEGVITSLDFQNYKKSGQFFSVKITFMKDCGELETITADRCN